MLFNSAQFLFIFLPITLLVFHLARGHFKLYVLCISSLFFYYQSGQVAALFLIVSIVWGYITAKTLNRSRTLFFTFISVSIPLGILIATKYNTFLLDEIPGVLGAGSLLEHVPFYFKIMLPAGISFYTFQIISYSIDCLDNKDKTSSLLFYSTYICFFPQLIAGPILRYDEIAGQFKQSVKGLTSAQFSRGLKLLSIGMFGKTVVADLLGLYTDTVKNTFLSTKASLSIVDFSLYVLGYSMRIYYDFWSYSVMAIGLAALFAFELPRNFNEPYLSTSPREFWRRWHITLSNWLKDYVYLRLSGNKKYVRNILVVFILCGIWHGSGFSFIAWGAWHAALVLLYHFTKKQWEFTPRALQIALTFFLVSIAWPLFDIGGTSYFSMLSHIRLDYRMQIMTSTSAVFILVITLLTFIGREKLWLYNEEGTGSLSRAAAYSLLLFVASLFFSYTRTFIYFRF